jgi:hypothetical protein
MGLEPKFKQPTSLKIRKINKEKDKFYSNETYQRSVAWTKERRKKLLESIFTNLPIGLLFLKIPGNLNKYEILDGQQRIETIKLFLNNRLKTSDNLMNLRGKYFNELHKTQSRNFLNYKIWYLPISGGTEENLSDIFLRLQEGVPLNSAERLNTIQTKMRKSVIAISEHGIFSKIKKIKPYRFAHRRIAAQCVWYEVSHKFNGNISVPRHENLVKTYKEITISKKVRNKIFGTLDFIDSAVGDEIKIIGNKSDFVLIYLITTYLRNYKRIILDKDRFREFITIFFTLTDISDKKNIAKRMKNTDYLKYKKLRSGGSTTEIITKRFQILLKYFWLIHGEAAKKDSRRYFDDAEKKYIYYIKSKRLCSYCKNFVSWNTASFDHIIPISQGGKTTIDNGRLVHKGKCHEGLEKLKKRG